MASGTENVYTLGSEGVNVVDSPIHLKNGEVRRAQNAAFPTAEGQGGLGMRGGLARINGSAMASSVAGLINVPLPAPGSITRSFHAALMTADSDTWAVSTDSTTFAEGTTPNRAQTIAQLPSFSYFCNRGMLSFNRKIYFFGSDYTVASSAPPVRIYDGVTDFESFRVPFNPSSGAGTYSIAGLDWCVHNNRIYFSVYDPGGVAPDHKGRVFGFDPDTGLIEQIGNAFGNAAGENAGGMPFCLASYNGYLVAGTYGIAGLGRGRVYKIRPGEDTTWTQVYQEPVGGGYIISMAAFRGDLFFGTSADAGNTAYVRRFTNFLTGATANSDSGPTTGGSHYFGALIAYNSELYATFVDIGSTVHIRKFDGSSWSTDRDVDALDQQRHVGQAFVYNSVLYLAFAASAAGGTNGFLLRKAAGTYTKPMNNVNLRGFFGRVDIVPS